MRIGRLLFVLFSFGALVAPPSAAVAEEGFVWQEEEEDHVDLLYDGRPALRYMMPTLNESTPETRAATFKPFYHVFSPDGATLLTNGAGAKLYPHHQGLFYGFNKITYGDGKKADTWHCTGKAYQEAAGTRWLTQGGGEGGSGHSVLINWHGQDREVFAVEHRGLDVQRETHHGAEGWLIDFTSHLEPAEGMGPIHLDGDPQHAGFHFRANPEVADQTAKQTYYLRTDGKGQEGGTINWDPAKPDSADSKKAVDRPWNAMSIVVGGNRYTILYLDHPQNPKPARYSERDYGRFGSYFAADVTKEKPLDVKYRLWVRPGEMTVEQCEKMHHDFIN